MPLSTTQWACGIAMAVWNNTVTYIQLNRSYDIDSCILRVINKNSQQNKTLSVIQEQKYKQWHYMLPYWQQRLAHSNNNMTYIYSVHFLFSLCVPKTIKGSSYAHSTKYNQQHIDWHFNVYNVGLTLEGLGILTYKAW